MDFTEDDIAQLGMTPLMGGQMSRKDKIKEGILIAKEDGIAYKQIKEIA